MHNPLDLPNIYPTAPKLSNKNGVSVVWIYNTLKLAQPNNWFFPAPCPHPRYNLKSHCYNFSVGVFGSFCPVWVIECGRVVLVVLGRVVGSKRGWVGADGFKPESAILRVLDSFGTLRGGVGRVGRDAPFLQSWFCSWYEGMSGPKIMLCAWHLTGK